MYFLWHASCARTTTSSIRSTAACWLFLLTLISMQHHRLNRDCCQGAAILMQQQYPQQQQENQQQQRAAPLLQQAENIYKDASGQAINSKVMPPSGLAEQLAATESVNKVTNTITTKTVTETKSTAAILTENAENSKNSNNKKYLDKITAALPDDFINDAPAAGKSRTLAWDDPETLLHRRHIVPEKLQYTSEISIKQGRLVGIIRHMQLQTGLRDVNQYLGLPYAEAPVGSRRFMPPGTPLPWQGLKTARHLPPVCPQKLPDLTQQGAAKMPRGRYKQLTRLLPYLKNENEDCLYLNVYVPREEGLEQTPLYPVLVYIHGEAFEWNSGNAYDGSVLASYGQVIVVTVNFRLGVLGFMKPSINERTVANFGLLDQIAALHWIKENIAYFGGDRESVTLMGHSTGAACVNYLMVSPVASGLFHRAILMSGSAMSDWAASNHSLQLTMQIAHQLDCPLMDDNDEMIDCLRSKRYQDILKISTSFPQFSTSLGPIVDGHVIPNQPYKVMGQYTELFSRYDLLFGITESESFHTLGALALEEGLRENERDNLLRFYMQSRYDVRPDLALAATLKKYNDMYNNPIKATNMEHRDVVLDILSDARIVGPLMQTGLFHADVNPHNYMYVFGHNSAAGPHASLPHSIAGEELAFVFGAPLAPSGPFHNSYNTQEKLLSEAVMAYWTNFAKTGNPKAPWKGTFINLHAMEWDRYDLDWPEFNKRTQAYINIGIPPSIGYKYRQIYMNFWNKELPDELNQIATMQQQPFLLAYNGNNPQIPRGGTSLQPPRSMPGEVITGHMSKFGNRDNGAEDPVRTLKLLLQEPYGKSAATINAETAENMYNAPPTFGVTKQQAEDELLYRGATHAQSTQPTVWGVVSNIVGSGTATTAANNVESHALPPPPPPPHLADPEQELAKSESTMQLLIGLIIVFIVLNLAIYATFLLQKRRKKSVHSVMRKLGGAGGILSYDGNTDDELKRSKHTTHDGDDNSYILDIVRKSNTYEAVKTERSPINGYKITRQLSCSTVDTHTKVCEWMAGGGAGCASTLKREGNTKTSKHSSSSPTFCTLRGGSSSGGGSFQPRAHKVNVAIDATPQARGQSIACQQPIELTKQQKLDGRNIIICQEVEVEDQELLMPDAACCAGSSDMLMRQHSAATEPCDCVLPNQHDEQCLPVSHKHSRSDPVELIYELHKQDEQITSFIQPATPPDINVTSRDDEQIDNVANEPLTATEQLALIKRRNYPKVLPTLYKRNSLPPNGLMLQQIMACGKQQPPMPPPRTISTLGRKPGHGHTADRRCSGGITTSPVMLAKDFSVAEEDEPQQMTENTLIVGPIVPKLNYTMSMLRRQKQKVKNEPAEQLHHLGFNETAQTTEAAGDKCLDAVKRKPTTLQLPTMFSFESQPQSLRDSHVLSPLAHHTEAVYAIQPLNLAASMPSMPAMTPTTPLSPTFNFYTAPSTPVDAAGTCADGAIYAQSSKVSSKNKHNNLVTAATEAMGTAKSQIPRMLQTAQDVVGSTCSNMTATTTATAAATTASTAKASSSAATTTATTSASRIPQLNRSLNTLQQQQINKNHSTAAVDDKTTPTTAITAAASTTLTTSTTANLQNPPSIAAATGTSGCSNKAMDGTTSNCSSFAPTKSSLRAISACSSDSSSCNSSRSSATSSASSTTSSSSSSTGTVRTEFKQK